MNIVETKYGILNGAHLIGKYITGESEYYSVDEISKLKVLGLYPSTFIWISGY